MQLLIGNKRYSSWSLRPWLALAHHGLAFEEILIPLYRDGSKEAILRHSPSGKVPALIDGGTTVWDSLAILETLAERFPELGLWPRDPARRALARSVSAEMHSGFAALRNELPMDLAPTDPGKTRSDAAEANIDRVTAIWRQCREAAGAEGPFLFGGFGAADCMYAPVVLRLDRYRVPLDPACRAYADAVLALPAMRRWVEAGMAEPWVLTF
ncbi:glutathione S-transferase family protein [Inquilinus limosus]|uniref:Glutathione S-transferase n=1 Tax=Inquilinus limosus TaxID=171674 RepID=A0A211Z9T3_9PROT|nr:glutathione S-transferase family protein [Inquilinus limosus]OWJ61986.1 glutathione S-transferase [Inquilinus limosus]